MTKLPLDPVIAMIEEGQRLRGWISNGYAQVEYILGDIITQAFKMPQYEAIAGRLPHRVERRIAKVREILAVDAFFANYRDEIEQIIALFEDNHSVRNLLAHGFCTAYHTPDGDFGLEFRKWHRDREQGQDVEVIRTFRIADLEFENTRLTQVSQRALTLSFSIHEELGLVGHDR